MQNALFITVWGIGITFGAILLFWGLIWLLTALPEKAERADAPAAPPVEQAAALAQAAAVAVAVALARQGGSNAQALSVPPTAIVSAWQLGMRTRQMAQKGNRS